MQIINLFRQPALLLAFIFMMSTQSASARELPDFTDLVKDNSAAVVNISTTTEPKAASSGGRGSPFDQGSLNSCRNSSRTFSVARSRLSVAALPAGRHPGGPWAPGL